MAIQDLGDNIRRLMKLQELTIPALADRIEMGTAYVSNLLNGKADPKSTLLIKISEVLAVSVQDLLADVPRLKSLRFRTSKTLSAREKAERDQLKHITAKWIADYAFLEEVLGTQKRYEFQEIEAPDPKTAARAIRERIGYGIEPIHDMVRLVTEAGIKLRVAPFGFKKTFGLSVGEDDGGPAIVVNSEMGISIERQIFTIAHELGHLLLHSGSYGSGEELETDDEEKEANSFAGQLLLPDAALIADWQDARGIHWVDAVLRIKKKYRVSYMAVLVRLSHVFPELASRNLMVDFRIAYKARYHHDLKDFYEPNAIEGHVAQNEADGLSANDLAEDRFSRMVMQAYEKQEISIGRAAEMLGSSVEDMRSLVKGWQGL